MAEATTTVPDAKTPTQQPRRSKGLSERRLAFFMVSPSMILIALVAAYPIAYGIWLSLHEYSVRVAGLSRWAGLRNYSNALSDSDWWAAFFHTMIFAAASVTLELLIGLAMAMAMHAAFRGQGVLRTTVLVPWAVLTVVTAGRWWGKFGEPLLFGKTLWGTATGLRGEEAHARVVIILPGVEWEGAGGG